MTAVRPVAHGTAEALARVQHFRGLDLPEAHELDPVARLLVGPVDEATEVLEHVADELDQLWSLITDDFYDDQLDELTDDDWARNSFSSYQQEIEHRRAATVTRLVDDIEGHIHLARLIRAENVRTAVAS